MKKTLVIVIVMLVATTGYAMKRKPAFRVAPSMEAPVFQFISPDKPPRFVEDSPGIDWMKQMEGAAGEIAYNFNAEGTFPLQIVMFRSASLNKNSKTDEIGTCFGARI